MATRLIRQAYTHIAAAALGAAFLLAAQQTLKDDCHPERYDLLNPAMSCSELRQGEWDYEPLRDLLLSKKEAWKASGTVSHLSVYFRDLTNGPRFGIGEWDKFHPASLRKVAVMIAILHIADYEPGYLDRTLSFTGALRMNRNVEEVSETLLPGVEYTIRELLEKMIVYSDNYSYALLTNELNATSPIPYYTFRDLDVLRMMIDPKGSYVSIQSYSTLFAVLHNTGYLSRDLSQYALMLLSQATFTDGLVSGVPNGTRVAHKFGQLQPEHAGGDGQLHDCGIIYHPSMHYVLCIMTSGSNEQAQKSVIADVSRTVYNAVSAVANDEKK